MRVPILAYHANNIAGNAYAGNDHTAFASDLRLIHQLGLKIVPLQRVVDRLLGRSDEDLTGCVGLCCDDGTDFDYLDIDHPTDGPQRSLFNCMTDFIYEFGIDAQPDLHLTNFVIASPEARDHLDRHCLVGAGWMNEHWWRPALQSGRIAIGNHSWDHNHAAIPSPGLAGMTRGSFQAVDNYERADIEIASATRYLNKVITPDRATLFCYPFSETNDYLLQKYFPAFGAEHAMDAAFGAGAEPVTMDSNRWNLPRYVCGWHWQSPEGLRGILKGVLKQ